MTFLEMFTRTKGLLGVSQYLLKSMENSYSIRDNGKVPTEFSYRPP